MSSNVDKVSKRYAKAYYELVNESQRVATAEALGEISRVWKDSSELQAALLNPAVAVGQRIDVLKELVASISADFSKETLVNFLSVILENRRLSQLGQISAAFKELLEEAQGKKALIVTSARSLPESEKSDIENRTREVFGKDVSITWEVEPALIAGLRIKVGDQVYDATVQGSLIKAKEQIGL